LELQRTLGEIMFCTSCGYEVLDDEKFCSKCGNKIEVKYSDQNATKVEIQNSNQDIKKEIEKLSLIKKFTNSLAFSIWWKMSLSIAGLAIILAYSTANLQDINLSITSISIIISVGYFLITIFVPYTSLKNQILKFNLGSNKIIILDKKSGVEFKEGYLAQFTWGCMWRMFLLNIIFSGVLIFSGYNPSDEERFVVALILVYLVTWISTLWLIYFPYGNYKIVVSDKC